MGTSNIYLILEYVGSKCLYDYLDTKEDSNISEEDAKAIFKNLAMSLEYMHSMDVSHPEGAVCAIKSYLFLKSSAF